MLLQISGKKKGKTFFDLKKEREECENINYAIIRASKEEVVVHLEDILRLV